MAIGYFPGRVFLCVSENGSSHMKWKKILTFCGKPINMFYSELFSMKQ